MRSRPIAYVAVALLLGKATAAGAQTTGIAPPAPMLPPMATAPIAPGADIPATSLGGIGPGGVAIAPGSAAIGDTDIARFGPGGTRLAPGPAGSVSGSPVLSAPAVPGARVR